VSPPNTWDEGHLYRACAVCDFGRTGACTKPDVTGGREPVAFTLARSNSRACGPDAYHLDFPGLYLKKEHT